MTLSATLPCAYPYVSTMRLPIRICILEATSTDDEMTEPQSGASTVECDEIADANENKPAAAAQNTYVITHWDGFESAHPHA